MARLLSVTSMAVLLLWSASAKAAEDVVRLVPCQALGFVVVHHVGDADVKLQKIAKQVQAPFGSLLMMAKGTAGISKGLDEKGDAAMIVMSLKGRRAPAGGDEKDEKSDAKAAFAEVPAVVLLVPVTDYKEFLDQFHPAKAGEKVTEVEAMGKTALVASRGGYARDGGARHRKALETVLETKQGIDADLADLLPWLAETQSAGVATARTIKLWVAKQIEQSRQMRQYFANMQGRGSEDFLAMMDRQEKIYEMIGSEICGVSLGMRVDAQVRCT